MDRPYDGHVEQQQMRDGRVDKAAGQTLSSEATGLAMSSLTNRVANCEAAGLSFASIVNRTESSGQSTLDFGTGMMFGMFDRNSGQGLLDFGPKSFASSARDSAGNRVSMDSSGKLMSTDNNGRTTDFEARGEGERNAQRNATIIPAIFLGTPLALIGMGATLAVTDQAQRVDQQSEGARLRENLGGAQGDQRQLAQQQQQQPNFTARGYISDITMMSMFMGQDKKPVRPTSDIYSLSGLAPELFPNQRMIERSSRAREQEKKAKAKAELDKLAGVERQRSQMRVKMSMDRSSLTTVNMQKRKEQLENEIELAQGSASLQEVSRMHSELEVLDRALKRFSSLGL